MKLVIDIDEERYKRIDYIDSLSLKEIIKNGTSFEEVLRGIMAEIKEEKDSAYADFERYKVEYLGQEWEDVLDSLPTDDYRYGMIRCLEIIDKHISRNENDKREYNNDFDTGYKEGYRVAIENVGEELENLLCKRLEEYKKLKECRKNELYEICLGGFHND